LSRSPGAIARSASRLRLDSRQTRLEEFEALDEGVDEADRIVGADIVVDGFGQKKELRAFVAGNVRHARL
jgi:hypothetical protein